MRKNAKPFFIFAANPMYSEAQKITHVKHTSRENGKKKAENSNDKTI